MSRIVIVKPNKTHREEMRLMYWIKKMRLERVGMAYVVPDEAIPHLWELILTEIDAMQNTPLNQSRQETSESPNHDFPHFDNKEKRGKWKKL